MSFNFKERGQPLAKIGKSIVYLDKDDNTGIKQIKAKNNDIFSQLPSIEGRDILYISGPSGAGKSTYSHNFAEKYHIIHPDNKIYLISRVKNDASLNGLNMIEIDPENFDNEVDIVDLDECLVIFDDSDQLPKVTKDKVTFFRDQLLELGRHKNISVVNTSHLLTNYRQSRTMLNEAKTVTFFPASNFYNIKRYLKEYVGLNPSQIETIKNLNSRWVTIFQSYPNIVMSEKLMYII
jgi:hypothetical protein